MHKGNDTLKKIKVARIVTIPNFFVHSISNLQELKKNGFEVDLICSDEKYAQYLKNEYGFNIIFFNIERDISPLKDLKSVFELYNILIKGNYHIVHTATPKAGIVGALAGLLARVPIRLHTFTGQRWSTLSGFKRYLLKMIDKFIILINTQCYTDSPSQIKFLENEKITPHGKLICLGMGSFGGVNFTRFNESLYPDTRMSLSTKFHINNDHTWILYVGRITRDKGIHELIEAFIKLPKSLKCSLLLVGTFEPHLDPIDPNIENEINNNKNIHFLDFQENPAEVMSASDLMCLPSYREGFGTVVIEAAACKLPTIGTNITGLVDAIENGVTGILIPPKDVISLKNAIIKLVEDSDLRKTMGINAKKRAITNFDTSLISKELIKSYDTHLKNNKLF